MEWVSRSCSRLRSLDIGKCDVSDLGLKLLSENCPNLKKLSVKSCTLVTDRGVESVSKYCRGLQHLNIQVDNQQNISLCLWGKTRLFFRMWLVLASRDTEPSRQTVENASSNTQTQASSENATNWWSNAKSALLVTVAMYGAKRSLLYFEAVMQWKFGSYQAQI